MDSQSTPILPLLVAFCLSGYSIYFFLIYPLLFHPLRDIPRAHWSVPYPYLGSVWILYQRYQSRNNAVTYQAHVQQGPVVRLGYNELSVNCVDDGIRTIYGGGWEKHEWYPRQFAGYDVINSFSTVHHKPHSQKKRTIANIYSKANLQGSLQVKDNSHVLATDRYLPLLQSLSDSGKAIDVHDMNNAFTMDAVSAYQFGISHSTNFVHNLKARRRILDLYHSRRDYEWHSAEIPPVLRRLMHTLHIPIVPKFVAEANREIESWNSKMCFAADAYLTKHQDGRAEDDAGDEPVVYKHFKTGILKLRSKDPEAGREHLPHIIDPAPYLSSQAGKAQMFQNELHSEMLDHLGAGHETSAIALTYLYWELSRKPQLQDRLRDELIGLKPALVWPLPTQEAIGDFVLPDPKLIDELPFLQALIQETLRLHSPIPGQEPRTSPDVQGGSTLGRYSGIPGGVRVSSMPYILHRNRDVFPEPEIFDPDRWLVDDEEKLKEMQRWFWAFGSGGRMCVGRHVAIQNMKLIVGLIYTNWTTQIIDDDGIEEIDTYTTRPTSNKLILKFTHR